MVRSKKRNSCKRTATGRERSIEVLRNQAKRMGLKASGSKAQICNRINAKIRRSKSPKRLRSPSQKKMMRDLGLAIDCKQYTTLENCQVNPNCNWLGGTLNRCQARSGVRKGKLYQGPMQQILAQEQAPVMFKGVSPAVQKQIQQQRQQQKQQEIDALKSSGRVSKSPLRDVSPVPQVTPVPQAPPAPGVMGMLFGAEDLQQGKKSLKKTPPLRSYERGKSPLQKEIEGVIANLNPVNRA